MITVNKSAYIIITEITAVTIRNNTLQSLLLAVPYMADSQHLLGESHGNDVTPPPSNFQSIGLCTKDIIPIDELHANEKPAVLCVTEYLSLAFS